MRGLWTLIVLAAATLSGCLDAGEVFSQDPDEAPCTQTSMQYTYWFDTAYLTDQRPAVGGATGGNSFTYAFVSDTASEWPQQDVMGDGIRILGDVTLDLWIERTGGPNPITSTDEPGQGWQLFSQFGTDHGFAGTYHNVYTDTLAAPGTVHHITQTFTMPEGGLVVEGPDHIRLLLTAMGLDSGTAPNHRVLWGGDTPSAVSFEAVCYIDREWDLIDEKPTDIAIAANNFLLVGPDETAEEDFNHQDVPFTLDAMTDRLTITLVEDPNDPSTPKDDMDLSVRDADGVEVWSIGSPYADESGRLWRANLDAFMPPGDYTVRVKSYSGADYTGELTIIQEASAE